MESETEAVTPEGWGSRIVSDRLPTHHVRAKDIGKSFAIGWKAKLWDEVSFHSAVPNTLVTVRPHPDGCVNIWQFKSGFRRTALSCNFSVKLPSHHRVIIRHHVASLAWSAPGRENGFDGVVDVDQIEEAQGWGRNGATRDHVCGARDTIGTVDAGQPKDRPLRAGTKSVQ